MMKKVTMKKTLKLQLALVACAMGMAVQSHAQWYNITFNGSGYAANGQIDVAGGLATSGYLTVTAGNDLGTYYLATGGPSVRVGGGTDLIYDNVVNPSADPFLDGDGLAFALNNATSSNPGFNLWGNSPGSYSLFDASNTEYFDAGGTATITPGPVPEPTTAGCFLLGLGALVCWGRFIKNRRS
jgi:hypothetical protein